MMDENNVWVIAVRECMRCGSTITERLKVGRDSMTFDHDALYCKVPFHEGGTGPNKSDVRIVAVVFGDIHSV